MFYDNPNDQIEYLVLLSEKKQYDLIFFELKHVTKSQERHIFLFVSYRILKFRISQIFQVLYFL